MATQLTANERLSILGDMQQRLESIVEEVADALAHVEIMDEDYDDDELSALERALTGHGLDAHLEELRGHLDAVEEQEEADERTFTTDIPTGNLVCDTCGAAFDTWTGAGAHRGCEPRDEE